MVNYPVWSSVRLRIPDLLYIKEATLTMAEKSSPVLTPEQRLLLTTIPVDIPTEDLVRYYTLSSDDLTFINRHHATYNRLGVALQLCVLRYPGRTLTELPDIPATMIVYVAEQIGVSPEAYARYGYRQSTLYEHLAYIREHYGYRAYDWSAILQVARHLLPLALENDNSLALVEAALAFMRHHLIIAPGITTTESLVWRVQQVARRQVYKRLTDGLTPKQMTALDELLQGDKGITGLTRLTWLRRPPGKPSSESLYHLLDRLDFLISLNLPHPPVTVHPHRIRQLANHCRPYKAYPLSMLESSLQRYALLVAYLTEFQAELIDQILDMFDRWWIDLIRKGRNAQKHHLYEHVTELNRIINTFTVAFSAFLIAREEGQDPVKAVFAVVDEDTLNATVASAQATMRPADMDYRDLLENRYTYRRKALLQMYRSLTFETVNSEATDPALAALEHVILLQEQFNKRVLAVEQVIRKQTMNAPLTHLKWTRWKRHALDGVNINPNYYEMGAWQRLKDGLRAGDIAVTGSHRYRAFDSYLLPPPRWQHLKATGQTRLAVRDEVQLYLDARQQTIKTLIEQLPNTLAKDEYLTIDNEGTLHLTRPEKSTPSAAVTWGDKLYAHLPLVELTEVLLEVAAWTGCLEPFIHLGTGQALTGHHRAMLGATLMGAGLNLADTQLAQATGFSIDQLNAIAEWHVRVETLQQAQVILDNFVFHHPFSRHWGRGATSSSDGMRLPVPVQTANTLYNARYFGFDRGLTIVTHTADIWMPFETAIDDEARETLRVIDALCHHETDFDLQEHYTDTGGVTYHVFALCMMLGFRFAPRIRSITEQYLFTVEPITIAEPLKNLIKGQVESELVKYNWDQMRRLAASIRHSTVSAALIMRKLAAYPKQNQLAQAFNEVGKLERTVHVLTYLQDPAMQQRVRRGLNQGEAIHSLQRALSIGQAGEMHERRLIDQQNRARCLTFLVSVISAWNTIYLDKVVSTLAAEGMTVPEEYLRHISPIGWHHINFLGKYEFDLSSPYSLNNLRPLRRPSITL